MSVCPECGTPTTAPSRFLPFCGERCQWIDLGRWLNEEHRLPVDPDAQDEPRPTCGTPNARATWS
jgi:endogenous inhibitor of DNA gyrase (YacG/DUF329 family)